MRKSFKSSFILAAATCLAIGLIVVLSIRMKQEAKHSLRNRSRGHNSSHASSPQPKPPVEKLYSFSISGFVKDENGDPVAGALVEVISPGSYSGEAKASTTSSDDGAYTLSGMIEGSRCEIVATARGFIPKTSWDIELDDNPDKIDLKLARYSPSGVPALPIDEKEAILSGAKAAIEKVQSGRIIYRRSQNTPLGITEDEYQSMIKRHREAMQRGGSSKQSIVDSVQRNKKEWKKLINKEGYANINYKSEYTFEEDNSYHSVTGQNINTRCSAYKFQGILTTLETYPDIGRIRAQIHNGANVGSVHLTPPFSALKAMGELLEDTDRWQIARIVNDGDVTFYDFEDLDKPRFRSFLRIASGRDYAARGYGWLTPQGEGKELRFDDFKTDSDTGIQYPTKLTQITRRNGKLPTEHTIEIQEVEFNRDYDDGLFLAPLGEDVDIADYRFDPPQRSEYSPRELTHKYLHDFLNEHYENKGITPPS